MPMYREREFRIHLSKCRMWLEIFKTTIKIICFSIYTMKESFGTFVVSASLESRFYCDLSTDLVSIINFTKLIDKKNRTTPMYHEREFRIH